jgi:hypothetical protein
MLWSGYPPPDKCVRKFLIVENIVDQKTAFVRSCAFLAALFDVIRRWIKFSAPGNSIASVFRQEMRDGMRFEEHGPFRTAFFQEVVRTAEEVDEPTRLYLTLPMQNRSILRCRSLRRNTLQRNLLQRSFRENMLLSEDIPKKPVRKKDQPRTVPRHRPTWCNSCRVRSTLPYISVMFLTTRIISFTEPRTREGLPQSLQPFQYQDTTKVESDIPTHKQYLQSLVEELIPADGPQIILVFDEAHDLTDVHTKRGVPAWSRFGELRRALHQVQNLPLFSLFLSTAGRFHHFSPARAMDPSARIQHGSFELIEPFVELDFDTFAQAVGPGECRLEDVEKTRHLVSLGRPL